MLVFERESERELGGDRDDGVVEEILRNPPLDGPNTHFS